MTFVVKNWLDYQDSPTHAISVACKTCGMDKNQSPISFSAKLKPFLVIYTHSQQRRALHRRPKRQINCGVGVGECCRESFYVSFADIGWDDWILGPEGYNAYFCKGSCVTATALALSATQHNNILRVSPHFVDDDTIFNFCDFRKLCMGKVRAEGLDQNIPRAVQRRSSSHCS